MRIISWNVNGLRAILEKDKNGKRDTKNKNVLESLILEQDPDIICLQETKCPEDCKMDVNFKYKKILSSKNKKGYSGVAILSKEEPINVLEDFSENEEGRLICLEFYKFYLINVYVPNSKPDLSRLDYRINIWESKIKKYINKLQEKKLVIYTGDLNVAPTELDIHTIKGHNRSHGFTEEERNAFLELKKECKMIDTFRYLHPNEKKYSWFSNFGKARENNKGWRIDIFLISDKLQQNIKNSDILREYNGSDHIPIILDLDI